MSGIRHRRKGDRVERAVLRALQERGLAAQRVPLSGAARGRFGGDLSVPLLRFEDLSHRAVTPYPQMSIAQIPALPVSSIAHVDCVLWLWTKQTGPLRRPDRRILAVAVLAKLFAREVPICNLDRPNSDKG